jgi:pyrroloquinoline quinone biosynthesis protein D
VSLSPESRPRLAPKARLKHDRIANEMLLLYPEHGLLLNASAAAIVQGCDGRTVAEIAESLAAPLSDVLAFLSALAERGLVKS